MIRDLRLPTFVITGLWNQSIFQPGWIALNIFNFAENTKVPFVQAAFVDPNGIWSPILFHENIGIRVVSDRLEIYLNSEDEQVLDFATKTIATIRKVLPHTPLSAIGINSLFVEDQPDENLVDTIATKESLESRFKIKSENYVTTISIDEKTDLNFSRSKQAAKIQFNFNFHSLDSSATTNKEAIKREYVKYFEQAKNILKEIYNLTSYDVQAHQFPIANSQ